MSRTRVVAATAGGLLVFGVAFGIGFAQSRAAQPSTQRVGLAHQSADAAAPTTSATSVAATGTTGPATTTAVPCPLSTGGSGSVPVPVDQVCSSAGAPHFASPQAAMRYLATAWNRGNVREVDYVTDPAGRQQMDSMAALMVNLRFKSCARNPGGDYTCYFQHKITAYTSPTTYPNPQGYPPGEAVFTVAPATGPGWYLTNVIHCG